MELKSEDNVNWGIKERNGACIGPISVAVFQNWRVRGFHPINGSVSSSPRNK